MFTLLRNGLLPLSCPFFSLSVPPSVGSYVNSCLPLVAFPWILIQCGFINFSLKIQMPLKLVKLLGNLLEDLSNFYTYSRHQIVVKHSLPFKFIRPSGWPRGYKKAKPPQCDVSKLHTIHKEKCNKKQQYTSIKILLFQQPSTYEKPEAASAVLGSWWWAVCRPKHVELRINWNNKSLIYCFILLDFSLWIVLWSTNSWTSSL